MTIKRDLDAKLAVWRRLTDSKDGKSGTKIGDTCDFATLSSEMETMAASGRVRH
jgi:hypothetical protein